MTRIIDNNIEMTRGDTAAIQLTLACKAVKRDETYHTG